MNRFGLAPLVTEGSPYHPDDLECDEMEDEWYLKQLQAYSDYYGIDEAKRCFSTRPYLLEKLEKIAIG